MILNADVLSTFPSGKRLDQAGVLAVLKRGKCIGRRDFEVRFLISGVVNGAGDGKIAISVPKRLLKSSVARNRIKRLVREEFRIHRAAAAPLEMLVNYKARIDARKTSTRRELRVELAALLEEVIVRALRSHTCERGA